MIEGVREEDDGTFTLLDGYDLPAGWEYKGVVSDAWYAELAPRQWRRRDVRIQVRPAPHVAEPDVIARLKDRSPNAKVHLVPHRTDKPFHTTAGHLLSLIEGDES